MKRIIAAVVIRAMLVSGVLAAEAEMPELDHPWTDGLYSTITAPFCADGAKPRNAKWLKLRVDGMKSSVRARAVIQKDSAPLVVILNGTFGRSDDAATSLWMAWLEERGCHVVTFDSTFHQAMTSASRHGMAGHLEVEAELTGRIIQTFLQHKDVAGKVTKVGVAGMSYGATQALLLAKLDREGGLPFHLDAVQAYSAPVSVAASMRILDDAFTYDWRLSDLYWKFYNLRREFPVREQYDPAMMRAAVARIFRLDLKQAVEQNDELFGDEVEPAGGSRLLPKDENKDQRLEYAAQVGFGGYYHCMAAPYWAKRGRPLDLNVGDLATLLRNTGGNVEAIVARNDPLNEDGAVERLAAAGLGSKLTVLPRGGHLGFANSNWVCAKLARIFGDADMTLAVK
ncbi:MAG: hypothetical protein NTW87_10090 [Planctomycetota bacterium]|nr:hypothetical protein [Planctomycetota bacterium]